MPNRLRQTLDTLVAAFASTSQGQLQAFLVLTAVAAGVIAQFSFVPVLDHINLAFHEAGHPIFGLLGELPGWLGGTLGQFVFPIATTIHFWRSGQVLSAATCGLWGFENIRYVAAYLGDARSQALPLVGGGEHDWAYLLDRWGLLQQDHALAGLLTFTCWAGWALIWSLAAHAWWQARRSQDALAKQARLQHLITRAREQAQEKHNPRP